METRAEDAAPASGALLVGVEPAERPLDSGATTAGDGLDTAAPETDALEAADTAGAGAAEAAIVGLGAEDPLSAVLAALGGAEPEDAERPVSVAPDQGVVSRGGDDTVGAEATGGVAVAGAGADRAVEPPAATARAAAVSAALRAAADPEAVVDAGGLDGAGGRDVEGLDGDDVAGAEVRAVGPETGSGTSVAVLLDEAAGLL